MGALCSGGSGSDSPRVLMLGLDAAGKTTIVNRFNSDEVIQTVPTIGFNVDTVHHNNIEFQVWDLGGQDTTRNLWKHYYEGTKAIIFVVDSNDKERIDKAAQELHKLLKEEHLINCFILIFGNKQDIPNCLNENELKDKLNVNSISKTHKWKLQLCSAKQKTGITQGLDWLSNVLKPPKN